MRLTRRDLMQAVTATALVGPVGNARRALCPGGAEVVRRMAPQTASPVCGTKNFSSVRLYSARRNCIEQLSTSPEYAPQTVRFPARNSRIIRLRVLAELGIYSIMKVMRT
jgi:hypothetical protein